MTESLLPIGVIGAGHLGRLHARMFQQLEQCDFKGVYDTTSENAQKCVEEFGGEAFPSLEALLDQVQAVSIAATTTAHYELAKTCFEKGIHVFIEKPITSEIAQAEELVALAREKNLVLQVGHIERFNPALLAMEKYALDPVFIQTDRLAQFKPRGIDVAVVHDLMIHDIDIILSLVKSPVKKVDANGVAVVSDHPDIANARLEFENGTVAIVTASRISQKAMRKMRLFQRDAYITLDFTNGQSELFRLMPAEQTVENLLPLAEMGVGDKKKKLYFEQPEPVEINALLHELGLFADCVRERKEPVITGEDGLRALRVAEQIIEKINESRAIIESR